MILFQSLPIRFHTTFLHNWYLVLTRSLLIAIKLILHLLSVPFLCLCDILYSQVERSHYPLYYFLAMIQSR